MFGKDKRQREEIEREKVELERLREQLLQEQAALVGRQAALSALEKSAQTRLRAAEKVLGRTMEESDMAIERKERPRFDLSWLRHEDIVRRVAPEVNQLRGQHFSAFSMPDGRVYVKAALLDQIIRTLAAEAGRDEVAHLDDRPAMRRIMIATANFLKRHEVIAEDDLPGRGSFGRNYTLHWQAGPPQSFFYLPFQASAFGVLEELEAAKPQKLKDIARIEPIEEFRP